MKNFGVIVISVFLLTSCFLFDDDEDMEDADIRIEYGVLPMLDAEYDSIPILDSSVFFQNRIISFDPTFDLEMPPSIDQGSKNSCVAFATTYAARSYLLYRDLNLSSYDNSTILSPEFVFNKGKFGNDCSFGIKEKKALDILKNIGSCTIELMPYTLDENNDCIFNANSEQLNNADLYKITSYYRVHRLNKEYLKSILTSRHPIICVFNVDGSLSNNRGEVWKQYNDSNRGKHAMVLCGWDDNKNAWKLFNSSGSEWGDNGYCWIDYDFFNQAIDRGTTIGNIGFFRMFVMETLSCQVSGDQDGDQICGNFDCNDLDGNNTNFPGKPCDDGNPQTINDVINSDCQCFGDWTYGSFTDARDGQTYNTIQIGNQTWMAENLNYSGVVSYCYNDDPSFCEIYGRLYDWDRAMEAVPDGWHIPSLEEWNEMVDYLGSAPGGKLKDVGILQSGTGLWNEPNAGATNLSGFTGLPGGFSTSSINILYRDINSQGVWWLSDEPADLPRFFRGLRSSTDNIGVGGTAGKDRLHSVRLIKD